MRRSKATIRHAAQDRLAARKIHQLSVQEALAERAGNPCAECGHTDPHRPHPDGIGWPSTVLKCASCPDGKCLLKEAGR
jgi:hypothetical protein